MFRFNRLRLLASLFEAHPVQKSGAIHEEASQIRDRPAWSLRLIGMLSVGVLAPLILGCDSGGSSMEEALQAPSAPSALQASTEGDGIVLEWDQPSPGTEIQHNVYRSVDSIRSVEGRSPVNADPVDKRTYTDSGAERWQTYHYRVTALRSSGEETAESALSGEVQYTLPSTEYVLEAPDPNGPPGFGVPLNGAGDINGDGTRDFAVGTFSSDSRTVYLLDGSSGDVLRRVRPEGLSSGEPFGPGGVGVGDVDGDGAGDLLVGTTNATVEESAEAGRAHLISGADGSVLWKRASPEPQVEGRFGNGTSIGDLTGDGSPDLAVVASGEDAGEAEDAGRIYLLDGTDGTVLDTLTSPDPQREAGFGFPTTNSRPDFNGDGTPDPIVRVPFRDIGGQEDAGRVYLLDGASLRENRDLQVVWTAESPRPEDGGRFGFQGSIVGDISGDGTPDLLIGAPSEAAEGAPEDAGRAYLISGADGSVIRAIGSPRPNRDAFFGNQVAGSGDLSGDGTPDLAIRGVETLGGFFQAGRIYLFDGAVLAGGGSPKEAVLRRFVSPNPEREGFLGTDFELLPEEGLLVAGANGETGGGTEDGGRLYAFPLP